ncbi:hypothetical protein FACS1894125_3550 [Actinomycetota bacterium]|nr:hypothetical protein FACS1894125_3550 [Actinomycetota bacterium]
MTRDEYQSTPSTGNRTNGAGSKIIGWIIAIVIFAVGGYIVNFAINSVSHPDKTDSTIRNASACENKNTHEWYETDSNGKLTNKLLYIGDTEGYKWEWTGGQCKGSDPYKHLMNK